MARYCELSKAELTTLKDELTKEYENIKAAGMTLDMSRGKPAGSQLDLSNEILTAPIDNYITSEGIDSRKLRYIRRYKGNKRPFFRASPYTRKKYNSRRKLQP